MKRYLAIWLLLIATALASCGHPSAKTQRIATPRLSAIDSVMWQQPDSAFTLLLAFAESPEADSLVEFNGHYFQLLVSELLYKNDYEQTNRKDLLKAVAYFDTVDNAFLDARAHYINGVGFYEHDSVVSACEEYLKALEIMESRFVEKEMVGYKAKFMALVYTRLEDLFSEQFMSEYSIICAKKALCYNLINPVSKYSVSRNLYHIGLHFDFMDHTDSAFCYYQRALEQLPDTNNVLYRDIYSNLLYSDYINGNYHAKNGLKRLLSQANDQKEALSRCLAIGGIYYNEGEYDSAVIFLDKVYKEDPRLLSKIQAAEYLKNIYFDDDLKTKEYTTFLSQYVVSGIEQKLVLSDLSDLFEKHLELGLNRRYEKRTKTSQMMVLIGLVLFLVASIAIFSFLAKRKTDTGVQPIREERQQQEGFCKGKGNDYNLLLQEAICLNLIHRFDNVDLITTNKTNSYTKLAISSKEERLLLKAVVKHCPDYEKLLLFHYPSMKNSDVRMCRFFLIGLNDKQISVLFQIDFTTGWRRLKKMTTMMDCVDIQQHLMTLLFEK